MITAKQALEKGAKKLTATISNSAVQIIVEFSSGQEFEIEKAYFVNGRQPRIKLLIDCEGEENSLREKIEELEGEIENYEEENKELEKTLSKWENTFGDDPDSFEVVWLDIETAIKNFAEVAEIRLGHNDGNNINALCEKYENLLNEIKESDEVIGELKLENLATQREINNLKNKLAIIEKEAKL